MKTHNHSSLYSCRLSILFRHWPATLASIRDVVFGQMQLSSSLCIRPGMEKLMRRMLRAALVLLTLILLSACSSGGPRKHVFPPSASVQELSILPGSDGWKLQLRLQNFSNVPHTISTVRTTLSIEGVNATSLDRTPNLTIAPKGVEIEEILFKPSIAAQTRIAAALSDGGSVKYELAGELVSSAPDKRNDTFKFEGQLWPVPGLPGVLR